MTRHDVRSVARVVAAAGSSAALTAVLAVITARVLGPAGQGTLTVLTTSAVLVATGATLGTGASLRVRAVPAPTARDAQGFSGLTLALAPAGGLLTAAIFALARGDGNDTGLLALAFVLGFCALAGYQASQLTQAYGSAAASIEAVSIGTAVQIIAFGVLALLGHASLSTAALTAALAAVVQTTAALRSTGQSWSGLRPRVDTRVWRGLVKHGWPTVGYGLGIVGLQRLDRVILVAVAGPAVGGVYAVAASVAEVARIGSVAVGQLLFVRTAGARAVTPEARRIYALGIGVHIASLAVVAALAPTVIPLVFGPEYSDAVPLAEGLLGAELLLGVGLMESRVALGLGRFAGVSTATVITVAAALPTYWLLISRSGAAGAVVASAGIYAFYCGLLVSLRRWTHGRRGVTGGDAIAS